MKKLLAYSLTILAAAQVVASDPADPAAPFDDYGVAMAHVKGHTTAAEWNAANAEELAAAVDEDVLARFVRNNGSAAALLAQVKGAYDVDPTAAVQIAAVSQWVLGPEPAWYAFGKASPKEGREIWVNALLARAVMTDDPYVKIFCLEQLRWCGYRNAATIRRVLAVGDRCEDRAVKEMAELVVKALQE